MSAIINEDASTSSYVGPVSPMGSLEVNSSKAAITFEAALDQVLEEYGANPLPNWSTNDLSALLAKIMRYQCDSNRVEAFSKCFDNTTTQDILSAISELRNFNVKALKRRYCLQATSSSDNCLASGETSKSGGTTFEDWSTAAVIANKARKIQDETIVLLPNVLAEAKSFENRQNEPISDSPFVRCNNLVGAPSYEKIYQILGSIIASRSISKSRSLDAAIVINIFDEMEEDAEKFVDQINFFRLAFEDLKNFDASEFKVDVDLSEENVAQATTNIFNLPEEISNLSTFVKEL